MSSEYTHRMTLIVPELMMRNANQLALIAGESPDDVNTFVNADWSDSNGNLYAVCSTVIKPIVLSMFGQAVSDSVLTDENADKTQAQKALDACVMYESDMTVSTDKIIIAIDVDPMAVFEALGLAIVGNFMDDVS